MFKLFKERIWNSPTFMTWGNMLIASVRLLVVTPVILVKYNVNEIAFWYLLATINAFIIVVDFGKNVVYVGVREEEEIKIYSEDGKNNDRITNWATRNY